MKKNIQGHLVGSLSQQPRFTHSYAQSLSPTHGRHPPPSLVPYSPLLTTLFCAISRYPTTSCSGNLKNPSTTTITNYSNHCIPNIEHRHGLVSSHLTPSPQDKSSPPGILSRSHMTSSSLTKLQVSCCALFFPLEPALSHFYKLPATAMANTLSTYFYNPLFHFRRSHTHTSGLAPHVHDATQAAILQPPAFFVHSDTPHFT